MNASTGGILRPPTEPMIVSLFETVAAATPARQPASFSANRIPRTFFGLPFRAGALKSMIANFVFGNRFATAAVESRHQEADRDHEVVALRAAVERFGM